MAGFGEIVRTLGKGGIVVAAYLLTGTCDALRGVPAEVVPRPTYSNPVRWVVREKNLRDIGGYATADGRTVRWNTVYRSGELTDLGDSACELFYDLNIRWVIDYRNRVLPSPLMGGDDMCVFEASRMMLAQVRRPTGADYVGTLEANVESYRTTFEMLSKPENLPLLYHCAAGKDRTGITTALLLTLLGVDRETVIADYALSEEVYPPLEMDNLVGLLDEVERRGGIEAYLEALGVSREMQTAIRGLLLQ